MIRTAFKWLYRLGLRRAHSQVDRIRYLKRLEQGKHPLDDRFFVGRDAEQFVSGGEVAISGDYRGRQVVFVCDPRNHFERLIIRQGFQGHAVLDCMAELSPAQSLVLDVGGNAGVYCVPLAAARQDLTVHAFEPNPVVGRRLLRNLSLNSLGNLVMHTEALADQPGEASFYRLDDDATLSSLNRHAAEIHGAPDVATVKVETIDRLFSGDPRRVGFIKIDVQGAELRVLEGARDTLRRHRPIVLLEHEDSHFETPELVRAQKDSLAALLEANGYSSFCLSRHDPRLMFPVDWSRPLHGDVLALPQRPA